MSALEPTPAAKESISFSSIHRPANSTAKASPPRRHRLRFSLCRPTNSSSSRSTKSTPTRARRPGPSAATPSRQSQRQAHPHQHRRLRRVRPLPCEHRSDRPRPAGRNYTGGSAASFQIDWNGRLSNAVSQFHYESTGAAPARTKTARRLTRPSRHHLARQSLRLINDLGLDCIHIYKLDPATAKLTANNPADWKAAPGSGPRVLRSTPTVMGLLRQRAQLDIDLLNWHPQNRSAHARPKDRAAPQRLPRNQHRRRDHLRQEKASTPTPPTAATTSSWASPSISPTENSPSPAERPCGGKTPRHIALDPTERWLLAANQDSNLIAVFGRDPKTGQLQTSGPTTPIQSPQCLLFVRVSFDFFLTKLRSRRQ